MIAEVKKKVEKIISVTCKQVGIPREVMLDTGVKTHEVVYARRLALYVTRKTTGLSFEKITPFFNAKGHWNGMHAFNMIEQKLLDKDTDVKKDVDALTKAVQ